jgi:hypothetical protein
MSGKRDLIACGYVGKTKRKILGSSDSKIVFKKLTGSLRFYRKGVKEMV